MENFSPISALIGGALIGVSASLLLWLNGRIAGISGIAGGLLNPSKGEMGWRALFLIGLVGGVAIYRLAGGELQSIQINGSIPLLLIGGLLVDGGHFDWEASGKFPTLTEPYEGFHNLIFTEEFGPTAFIQRARKEGLRDFGACMAPTSAFHILQGIETLSVRMNRHVDNTREIVNFLMEHPQVDRVGYPELEGHPDQSLAATLLPKGCGAVFSFDLSGGRPAGIAFVDALNVFSHLANIGDAKSLVIHPASTTHHRMNAEALAAGGIGEGTIRLSIGLEDVKDLIADLKQGLRAASKAAGGSRS